MPVVHVDKKTFTLRCCAHFVPTCLLQVSSARGTMQSGESEPETHERHVACMQHLLTQARDVIAQQHTALLAAVQQQATLTSAAGCVQAQALLLYTASCSCRRPAVCMRGLISVPMCAHGLQWSRPRGALGVGGVAGKEEGGAGGAAGWPGEGNLPSPHPLPLSLLSVLVIHQPKKRAVMSCPTRLPPPLRFSMARRSELVCLCLPCVSST